MKKVVNVMISMPVVKYVLTAAVRDRLIHSLLLLVVVGASLSVFFASSAVTESDQFALVFAAGALRFAGVMGIVLFIVFYLRRTFDSKDVEYFLSRPLSRVTFLLSHVMAFSFLAIFMAVLIMLAIIVLAPHMFSSGHLLWGLSLMTEFIIMANVALFFAFVLSSPATATLATFALYVLARMIGQILGIVDTGVSLPGAEILSGMMQLISLIIPRLDLMSQTTWLVYGAPHDIGYGFIIAQGCVYSLFIVMAALFDLVRRQF